MESDQLRTQNIEARLDVTRDGKCVLVVVFDEVLVGPLLSLLVISLSVDLEELDVLRLLARTPASEVSNGGSKMHSDYT